MGSDKYALLLIFQGMDAAGKDGAIKHVMSGVNPQGCEVTSFKQPSAEELEHDFLWRSTVRLPERGRIGIFNRSYYEEVLVVRVHPEILRGRGAGAGVARREEGVEGAVSVDRGPGAAPGPQWDAGGEDLSAPLEGGAEEAVSGADRRAGEELEVQHGGHPRAEVLEGYQEAFEECLEATSTHHAPWYAVPADDKENARLIVSQIVLDAMGDLKMSYPKTTKKRREELLAIRKQLAK